MSKHDDHSSSPVDVNELSSKELNKNMLLGIAKSVSIALFGGVILVILAAQFAKGLDQNDSPRSMTPEAIAARMAPVGALEIGDPVGMRTGEYIVNNVCAQCHAAGLAGAPKMGDNAAWASRIAQGFEVLSAHAIAGYNGGMPARGGGADLTDDEVKRATAYMANKSGANFVAPAVSTVSASAPVAAVAVVSSVAAASAPAVVVMPATAPAVSATPVAVDGKKTYEATCAACHATGAAGAPKFADKAAWAARIAKGKDTLYSHALNGLGIMPAKGGNPANSDADVKAAVDYMLKNVQ
jgi:cytochrome c5